MSKGTIILILLAMGAALFTELKGQDIHFSQMDINPLIYNPAYAGFFNGTGRFGVVYRNQWASVMSAYQTMAATAEYALLRRRYAHDGVSLGAFVYADNAGALSYGSTVGTAVLSYFKSLNHNNSCFVSVGAEAGYGQSGYNPANAEVTDPNESFNTQQVTYPLLGLGAAVYYQPSEANLIRVGLSGRNLNRPNISYMGLDDVFLERRLNAYVRGEFRVLPSVAVMPMGAVQLQNQHREVILGCDAKWYLSETTFRQTAFAAGLQYRWADALIACLSAEYNAFIFNFAYDANISQLTPASGSIGAFEMGIVYRLVHRSVQLKAMPCPNF